MAKHLHMTRQPFHWRIIHLLGVLLAGRRKMNGGRVIVCIRVRRRVRLGARIAAEVTLDRVDVVGQVVQAAIGRIRHFVADGIHRAFQLALDVVVIPGQRMPGDEPVHTTHHIGVLISSRWIEVAPIAPKGA